LFVMLKRLMPRQMNLKKEEDESTKITLSLSMFPEQFKQDDNIAYYDQHVEADHGVAKQK